eukprot:6043547-Pyramimonas_sp.AAC.2
MRWERTRQEGLTSSPPSAYQPLLSCRRIEVETRELGHRGSRRRVHRRGQRGQEIEAAGGDTSLETSIREQR